ncbi:MAG: ABC transporter substrate-binding protein [Cyanobacteria bacterium P01_D01_bin.1]
MARDNNSRFAIIATLLAFGLVGGISLLLWLLTGRVDRAVPLQANNSSSVALNEDLPEAVRTRVSMGEEVLFPDASEAKREGVEAIAQGDFASAVTTFNAALLDNPNDPESFIYRSNARIANQKVLTIAVIAPAGVSSDIGLEILRGVAQAQDDINRNGGVDGIPVMLVLVDDENDPELAQTIAEGLVEDPAVMGVVGHYSSDVTLATAPIYESGELVTITPVSTAVDLSGLSPYLYRTVPTDSFASAALSAYMLYYQEDKSVAVFFDSTSDLSASFKEEFNSFVVAWGGDVTAEYDLSDEQLDAETLLNGELLTEAGDRVDSIMIAASPSTRLAAADVINANQNERTILGGDELYSREVLEETGRDAQAMVVAVPWHLLSRDTDEGFVEASRDLWEGDVSWRTATAYDAVVAIAAGLEGDASRGGLKSALDDNNFSVESATGPIVFLPSGDRRQVDRLVTVEPGTRSGTGYDFVPFVIE